MRRRPGHPSVTSFVSAVTILRAGFLLTILSLIASPSAAQDDAETYFPLDEGNSWTYFQWLEPPGGPIDTLYNGPFTISGSVSINDTLYTVAPHLHGFSDTLRADAAGRIWARINDRDSLLFDFTLETGETYMFGDSEATVRKNGEVEIHSGTFVDAVTIQFDIPEAVDDEHSFTFAPGVGIIYATDGMGDYYELYSAVVAGEAIPSGIDRTPYAPDFVAYAYPNPFQRETTLVVSSADSDVEIFDILGRRIDTLIADYCSDRCRIAWDAGAVSSGVYFARIASRGGVRSIPLIVR